MAWSQAFSINHVYLVGGVSQAIASPRGCVVVVIFNQTAAEVSLYTTENDDTTILPIASGWSETIALVSSRFLERQVAFWLKCSVDGTVILKWI